MSNGTTLIYNGVILRNCETLTFDQSIEYDQSGTDVLFSRFRIRVASHVVALTSWLTSQHSIAAGMVDRDAGGGAPEQLRNIRERLSVARRPFYYFIDNAPARSSLVNFSGELDKDVLLVAAGSESGANFQLQPLKPLPTTVVPASQVIDCNNGPKPQHVNIERIFGGRLFRVTFEIEVCRRICSVDDFTNALPPGVSAGELLASNKILSNRWSLQETRGEDWRMNRVLSGQLRVASKEVPPSLMRYFCVPTQPRTMRRLQQQFTTDVTGLNLNYSITDQEEHEAPPAPAIAWSGHFVESGTGANAAKQHSEISIKLTGPPGVNKQDLIGAAGHVVKSRIPGIAVAPGSDAKNRPIIQNTSVMEVIGQPTIQLRVRVESTALKTKLAARIEQIGQPMDIPGYHPQIWPTPAPYKSESIAGQWACYLQNPCSVWHSVPRPGFTLSPPAFEGTESETDQESYTPPDDSTVEFYQDNEAYPDDETVIDPVQFSEEPYTFIEIESEYTNAPGYIALPFADGSVSEGQPTVEIVRLHSGSCFRCFTMRATRRDKMPEIPTPKNTLTDPNGISEFLQHSQIKTVAPEIASDGISRKNRVVAEYVYLLSRPPTLSEKIRLAISPIDTIANEDRVVTGDELFTNSRIDWQETSSG